MNVINAITILTFIFTCSYLAYSSIQKWLLERYNHEDIFFWGLSFLLMALVFLLYGINIIYQIPGVSYTIHLLSIFAIVFQMYSVVLNTIGCDNRHNCVVCMKKKIRLIKWIILIPIMTLTPIIVFNSAMAMNVSSVIGPVYRPAMGTMSFDITIEVIHAIVALTTFYYIPNKDVLVYLKYGFFIFVFSGSVRIVNIFAFSCTNEVLLQIEWAAAVVSILLMLTASIKARK
jgi:hypothetical protein